jgi:predicted DNA-binding transcriptional regulator AlpA
MVCSTGTIVLSKRGWGTSQLNRPLAATVEGFTMSTIVIAACRLITAHRVMDKLRISRQSFRRLLALGEFPKASSTDGQPRWSEQVVDQWLFANRHTPVTRRRGEK